MFRFSLFSIAGLILCTPYIYAPRTHAQSKTLEVVFANRFSHSEMFSQLQKLRDAKQFEEAKKYLQDLIKGYPSDLVIRAAYADLLLSTGENLEARQLADEINKIKPDYDWAIVIYAKACLALRDYNQAHVWINKYSPLGPKFDVAVLWGDYYREQKEYKKADSWYLKAIKLQPTNTSIRELRTWNLKLLIRKLMDEKKYKSALRVMKNLPNFSDDIDVMIMKAEIGLAQKEHLEAEKWYEEAYTLDKNKKGLVEAMRYNRILIALSFVKNKEIHSALVWLDKAQALGDSYEISVIRGNIYRDIQEYDRAEKEYLKAASLNPEVTDIHEARSWNFFLAGRPIESEKALREAISRGEHDPRYYVAMANLLKSRRYFIESLTYLKKALEKCEANKSCPRFNDIYDPGFFERSPLAGLNVYGPLNVGFGAHLKNKMSNVEDIINGYLAQEIDEHEYKLYIPPRLNRMLSIDTDIRYVPQVQPISKLHVEYEEAIKKEDPTIDHTRKMAILELEYTKFMIGLADVTFFPYIKAIQGTGVTASNESVLNRDYKVTNFLGGIRLLAAPALDKVLFETDFCFGEGRNAENVKFNDYYYRMLLLYFPQQFYGFTAQYSGHSVAQKQFWDPYFRDSFLLALELKYPQVLGFKVIYEMIEVAAQRIRIDNELEKKKPANYIQQPQFNIFATPHRLWTLDLKVGIFSTKHFKPYNHTNLEISSTVDIPVRQKRLLGKKRLPYETPISLSVGYSRYWFSNYRNQSSERTMGDTQGFFGGIGLFL